MGVPSREVGIVALLVVAGVVAQAVVALVGDASGLTTGDQPEYHAAAQLFADGHLFWGLAPTGEPHASLWKAPLYSAWLGLGYTVLGDSPVRVEVVQALFGGATIFLTWFVARRLFGQGVALAAAAVVTVYPNAWLFGAELYPEALAVPLVLLALYAFLDREPTVRVAAAAGALTGVNMLLRPSSMLLFAGIAVAFLTVGGIRRGATMTAVSILAAAVVIAPWTVRNYVVADAFVPISVQDAAIQGTFNEVSANDDEYPYGWRVNTPVFDQMLRERPRPGDVELRERAQDAAFEFIKDNPDSVPKAFFWNGLSRTWEIRRPRHTLIETDYDGRSRALATVGLVMYYLLLPLVIAGLVVLRHRREVLLPVLALFAASSIVFTIDPATRYRAPLEPLIVMLACVPLSRRLDSAAGRLTQA